jgi:RNA polymerase sigma-70 factor (ECF subfamily)
MCARLLSRKPDVDDAVQQTFLEAWRCLHRFEGKSRFTTWLTRIAIHTCFSFRRRVRRLLLVDDAALEGTPALTVVDGGAGFASAAAGGPGDPRAEAAPLAADEVASRRARSKALDEVLQQLSEKKRVVFVLADLEDLTSPEVAEILGIPEATVRTRLFYARKELAALLRTHKGFVDVARLHASRGEAP